MAAYDYTSAQASLARKRKLAELLQAQSLDSSGATVSVPGAQVSWAHPLAAMLKGYMARKAGEEADAESLADAEARETGAAEYMKTMPRDIPGIPSAPITQEQVGAPPPEAPPGPPGPPPGLAAAFGAGGMPGAGVPPKDNEFKGSGSPLAAMLAGGAPPPADPLAPPQDGPPMLPQGALPGEGGPPGAPPPMLPPKRDMSFPGMIPKLSTDAIPEKKVAPEDLIAFGRGFKKFGPDYADMAKEFTTAGIKGITPMSEDAKAQNAALIEQRVADRNARIEKAAADAKNEKLSIEERALATKRHDEMLRENAKDRLAAAQIARGSGGEKGPGAHGKSVGSSTDPKTLGWRVIEDGRGDQWAEDPKTGARVRNLGDVIPLSVREKEIAKTTEAREHVQSANSLVMRLEAEPDAYGLVPAAVSKVPGGQWVADKLLTEDQRTARAQVQREMSDIAHQIFGAAFSASEQDTARQWLVLKDDSAAEAYRKLKAMQAYAQRVLDNKGTVARAASEQRNPGINTGGTKAPAASQNLEDKYPEKK